MLYFTSNGAKYQYITDHAKTIAELDCTHDNILCSITNGINSKYISQIMGFIHDILHAACVLWVPFETELPVSQVTKITSQPKCSINHN